MCPSLARKICRHAKRNPHVSAYPSRQIPWIVELFNVLAFRWKNSCVVHRWTAIWCPFKLTSKQHTCLEYVSYVFQLSEGRGLQNIFWGLRPETPFSFVCHEFPYYFPNTSHLCIRSYCTYICEHFAYFKHAQWTTLQNEVAQAIKKSWRLRRMLRHSVYNLALSWRSRRILKKISGVGSTWNAHQLFSFSDIFLVW